MFLKRALIVLLTLSTLPASAGVLSLKDKPTYVPDEILVRFEDNAQASDKEKVLSLGLAHTSAISSVYKMKLAHGSDVSKMVDSIKGLAGVRYAQPNYKYYALACSIPSALNDTYFQAPYNWPMTIIQAPQAWTLFGATCPGSGVTVAVLDTGISRTNPDLLTVPYIGYNAICALDEEDPSCSCSASVTESGVTSTTVDDFGHGTWVSGIIAATWNGGVNSTSTGSCAESTTGMAGVAGGAVIMPIKVLDCTGSGTSDAIAAGINFAVAKGAKVLSMSLGGPADSLEEETIENAIAAGCVVVAAAGNESNLPSSLAQLDYPAGYPGVIAVGASDQNDNVAFYSNGGTGLDGKPLDLVAPGGIGAPDSTLSFNTNAAECIFSSFVCPLPSGGASDGGFLVYSTDHNYGLASGTSGATPFVSAAAALVFSMHPTWSNTEVVQQIINNTDSLNGSTGWDEKTGYGRLNLYKALSNAQGVGQVTTYVKTFNSPNPFYVDQDIYTNITLVMSTPQPVQLSIYDTAGELVLNKTYSSGQLNNNTNTPQFKSYYITWDGKNGTGQKVKTGVYFYSVKIGSTVSHNKIVVIQGPK